MVKNVSIQAYVLCELRPTIHKYLVEVQCSRLVPFYYLLIQEAKECTTCDLFFKKYIVVFRTQMQLLSSWIISIAEVIIKIKILVQIQIST